MSKYILSKNVSVGSLGSGYVIDIDDRILSIGTDKADHCKILETICSDGQLLESKENKSVLNDFLALGIISPNNNEQPLPTSMKLSFFGNNWFKDEFLKDSKLFEITKSGDSELFVLFQDKNEEQDRLEFCKTLVTDNKPGVIAYVDGWEFRVGPFIIPEKTACEKCLIKRTHALAKNIELSRSINNFSQHKEAQESALKICGSLLYAQIINHKDNNQIGCLYNKIIFGSARKMINNFHHVPRFPFCDICFTSDVNV